jgi:hypothetical protein
MVQKQTWSYLGKKDNCTLWNYCNNLYITYIVLKLGESTGMLIEYRLLFNSQGVSHKQYNLNYFEWFLISCNSLVTWVRHEHLELTETDGRHTVLSDAMTDLSPIFGSQVEQKAIFIGFSNEKCCFVMSRNNNKFAYIYVVVWQIWTETFSSDALKDSKLQNWRNKLTSGKKKIN